MSMQWETETSAALRAVSDGARIAQARPARLPLQTKESIRDIVSSVDVAIEKSVEQILKSTGHAILGEESGSASAFPLPADRLTWVVDPIDGTVNYVNGFGYYAISVGLCRGDEFLVGAVCAPDLTELYCTLGDSRALLNGKPLAHLHAAPEASLVAASFAGDTGNPLDRDRQYKVFGAINDSTLGCLRLGSATLNICNVAANRLQAAYGLRAKVWDVAGALAIARNAGCEVRIAAAAGGRIDYLVGSKDTVEMIYDLCVTNGLME